MTAEHEDVAELRELPFIDRTQLDRAIGTLPPAQQQAIHLLKLREMSLKEAAAATGISVAALKVATHRALKRPRRLLSDGDEP